MWAPVAQLLGIDCPVGTPLQRHYLLLFFREEVKYTFGIRREVDRRDEG